MMRQPSTIKRAALVLALLCLATAVFAQSGAPASAPTPPKPPAAAVSAKPAASAEYSDLDKAELQIVALQSTIKDLTDQLNQLRAQMGQCYAQLGPLVSKSNADLLPKLQEDAFGRIEARHAGYVIDRQSGLLVPKPAEAPAKK